MSNFDQKLSANHPEHVKPRTVYEDTGTIDGPNRSDLERWYQLLNGILEGRNSRLGLTLANDADLFDSIADVRDEIYSYLY